MGQRRTLAANGAADRQNVTDRWPSIVPGGSKRHLNAGAPSGMVRNLVTTSNAGADSILGLAGSRKTKQRTGTHEQYRLDQEQAASWKEMVFPEMCGQEGH
jgi:hypothetical protein